MTTKLSTKAKVAPKDELFKRTTAACEAGERPKLNPVQRERIREALCFILDEKCPISHATSFAPSDRKIVNIAMTAVQEWLDSDQCERTAEAPILQGRLWLIRLMANVVADTNAAYADPLSQHDRVGASVLFGFILQGGLPRLRNVQQMTLKDRWIIPPVVLTFRKGLASKITSEQARRLSYVQRLSRG